MSFAQGHTSDDLLGFDPATFSSLCKFSGIADKAVLKAVQLVRLAANGPRGMDHAQEGPD